MKYTVRTSYITYQHIEIEADSVEEAIDKSFDLDLDDWTLDRIKSGDTYAELSTEGQK